MLLVSHDSKYLFNVNGPRLEVYSVASGEVVYRLSYSEHHKQSSNKRSELLIKSICLNPVNKYQLLTFHLNGKVCLWDYDDGLLLKSFDTNLSIRKAIKVQSSIYILGRSKSSTDQLSLYKLQIDVNAIKNKQILDSQLIISNLNINADKLLIAVDSNEKYVAYVEGRKHLVINYFKSNNFLSKKFNARQEITCLTIHPNEDCIATGTNSGQIILWYNYLACIHDNSGENQSQIARLKPTMSILHWHSLQVLSVAFTTEGSYLLSGGHECVMVKWLYKSGQKDFKPRLGAPINELACSFDNTFYVTKHVDNSVHIISTNFNILQTLSGFICPNFKQSNKKSIDVKAISNNTFYPSGLNYFPHLNSIITNGKPGHLQFYAFGTDKLIFNLDISDENYISPENLDRPNIHTEIECVEVNHDSNWLVTVERRDDLTTTPETRLKFWCYDKSNNKFILNTLVRQPHAYEKINKIKFKPNENLLFSCGNDGCFKSWLLKENRLQATSDSKTVTYNWVYNTSNGYRDLSPSNIEFLKYSDDTDLIAVSFNHIITVWSYDSYNGILFNNDLIHCDSDDFIGHLRFFSDNKLMAVHGKSLNVWGLDKKQDKDVSDPIEATIIQPVECNCVWSDSIEGDVLSISSNLSQSDNQLLLIIRSVNYDQPLINENEIQSKIKIGVFEYKNKNQEGDMKYIHTLNMYSSGLVHFLPIPKTFDQEKSDDDRKIDTLLNDVDLFYCDNRGVLERLSMDLGDSSTDVENMDVDQVQSQWNNKKTLNKNLQQTSLSTIIELHKSNKIDSNDRLIENLKNEQFESFFKKIEQTPAYLMPKVGSFCYEFLKSMLHKIDDKNINDLEK